MMLGLHVTWDVGIWTVAALIGIAVAVYNWQNAWLDLRAVSTLQPRLRPWQMFLRVVTWREIDPDKNGRGVLAVSTLVAETIRVVVQAIFVVIGVLAMRLPPTPGAVQAHQPESVTLFVKVFEYGMVTAAILLAVQSVSLALGRERLIREIAQRDSR